MALRQTIIGLLTFNLLPGVGDGCMAIAGTRILAFARYSLSGFIDQRMRALDSAALFHKFVYRCRQPVFGGVHADGFKSFAHRGFAHGQTPGSNEDDAQQSPAADSAQSEERGIIDDATSGMLSLPAASFSGPATGSAFVSWLVSSGSEMLREPAAGFCELISSMASARIDPSDNSGSNRDAP